MGRNRSFRGIADQTKYKLTLQQLRDAQDEPLGEAITEALIQGLHREVENEGFNVQDYSLLVAVHSNSFPHFSFYGVLYVSVYQSWPSSLRFVGVSNGFQPAVVSSFFNTPFLASCTAAL